MKYFEIKKNIQLKILTFLMVKIASNQEKNMNLALFSYFNQ